MERKIKISFYALVYVLVASCLVWGISGCATKKIGSAKGAAVINGKYYGFDIVFSTADVQYDSSSNSLIITLSNLSGDKMIFTLRSSNTSSDSLNDRFPNNTSYSVEGGTLSASASFHIVSTSTLTSLEITSGFFNLINFTINQDNIMTSISGSFDVYAEGEQSRIVGDFNYSAE